MRVQKTQLTFVLLHMLFLTGLCLLNFPTTLAQNTPQTASHLPADPEQRLQVYLTNIQKFLNTGEPGAEGYINKAYQDFALIDFKKGMGLIQNRIGEFSLGKGAFSTAYDAFSRGKSIFEEIGDEANLAYSITGMGTSEGRRGNFEQCSEYLLQGLELFEKLNNKQGIGSAYLKLGTLNAIMNNKKGSLEYFERALPYALETDTFNVITIYNNMGSLIESDQGLDKSIPYYEKALELAKSEKFERPRILALTNLATTLLTLGKKEEGIVYLDEALRLANKHDLLEEKLNITLNRYHLTGVTHSEDLRRDLEAIYKQSVDAKLYNLSDLALTQLIDFHKQQSNERQVIAYLEEQNEIRTLQHDQNRIVEIARFQSRFDLEKSHENIDNLLEQISSQKKENLYIMVITIILLIGVFLLIKFSYSKNQMNRKLMQKESELRHANTVKDRLFSIIGHDLNGGLANQSMGIEVLKDRQDQDNREILKSMESNLENLREILDNLLNWGKLQLKGTFHAPIQIKLYPLIDGLLKKAQLAAEHKNVALINEIQHDANIYGDLDQITFIGRNLISNAIKFSYPGGKIRVGLLSSQDKSKKTFFVEDHGTGITKGAEEEIFNAFNNSKTGTLGETGNSLALMICKQFSELNNGRIWADRNEHEGATFFVEFPRYAP